jgi:hypothetical protein
MRVARSKANHAMSLEWTWWDGAARISQMPASGSVHVEATRSANPAIARQVSP